MSKIANPSKAAIDVIRERFRQISEENWSVEHDDQHTLGEMALAAASYAVNAASKADNSLTIAHRAIELWPWQIAWWKGLKHSARRQLVIAAALIIAEIERLDRLAEREAGPQPEPSPLPAVSPAAEIIPEAETGCSSQSLMVDP